MMKNFRIIPSLLIKDKRLVKGKNFKNHIDSGDPVKTCVAYDSQLADEIILVDLGAFEKKTKPDFETLDKVVNECNTPLTFGGNISNLDDAICAIKAGADKVLINTNLSETLINQISEKFGNQSIVAGIDLILKENKIFQFHNNQILEINIYDKISEILKLNIGELKITFVEKEGTKKGFNHNLAQEIIKITDKPIIFEGGFSTLKDIEEAFKRNINSIALGAMITFSDNNIFKIKQYLENLGYNMRLRD